jgi:glutathione S-transferase
MNRPGRGARGGQNEKEDRLMSQLTGPVKIFWISGSPFSWRVLLTAEVKGIPYEGKLLQVSKGELKTPEFLAINPLGRAPALRDGDFTLHESLAIMAYLDRKHPSPPLFGRTAEEAGRIFQCISEFISDFGPSNQRLIRSILFGPPLDADEVGAEREKAHLGLARLEGYAESGVWMAGSDISAADIVAYPGLKLLLRVSQRPEAAPLKLGLDAFEPRFPSIAAWMQRVEQLPGYDRTYPPHWRHS